MQWEQIGPNEPLVESIFLLLPVFEAYAEELAAKIEQQSVGEISWQRCNFSAGYCLVHLEINQWQHSEPDWVLLLETPQPRWCVHPFEDTIR